jgi:hypothetical protein
MAFLFGGNLDSVLVREFKVLGIYHLVVFSGAHLHFWRGFLRRCLYNLFRRAAPLCVEAIIALLLLVLHFGGGQGWSARRALAFQLVVVMLGPWAWAAVRSLWVHAGIIGVLFLIEPGALHSMGAWMSVTGSLLIGLLQDGSGRHHVLDGPLVSCAITVAAWFIAQLFGVGFFLVPAVVLGFGYGCLLGRYFGLLIAAAVIIFFVPQAREWADQWVSEVLQFHRNLVAWLCE